MLEKYCFDKEHAAEVAKYAVMIFDALNESVCKFSDREKEYLVQAAKLHDIGYFVGKKSHHKHSMKMILDEGLEGYSKEEIAIIANIASNAIWWMLGAIAMAVLAYWGVNNL